MPFGSCVAECRLGSQHSAPSFSNHRLNNSFSRCLRNLNKKSSIHTKKHLLMHEAEHAHVQTEPLEKKRTPWLPFNSGRIISESKHAKDAVKICSDETDICQASEPVILPDGRVESVCVCVCFGELSATLYSVSDLFPFMPDKVIYPTCH